MFYFTYSGHGTQLWDNSGEEADLYDEALCLWDRPGGIQCITDDTLRELLQKIRGSVFVILDSCYSGGMERAALPPGMKRKSIPFDSSWSVYGNEFESAREKRLTTIHRQYNLYACLESEVSYDTGGGGIFTTSLLHNVNAGRRTIAKAMKGAAKDCGGWQTPRYAIQGGSAAKNLF